MRIDIKSWLQLPLPTLVLGWVTLAIAVAIVAVAISGTKAAELLATPAHTPAPFTVDVSATGRDADLAAIRAQPLLHASRTFYVAPAPDATPAAPPRPDYRLAGTFLVPGKPSVALLANRTSGASKRVKLGEELEGWRVQVVDKRLVTLEWHGERFDITAAAAATVAASAPSGTGLKRVPMQRQRVASSGAGVQSLSATGNASSSLSGSIADAPRLYRPPPN